MPNDPESLTCDDCGRTDSSVSKGCCPYAQEVEDEDVPVCLCEDCFGERAKEI